MKKMLLLAVAGLVFISTPVFAKEGTYIGAYLIPSEEISQSNSGSGYGFRAGLGFNRYVSIEGNYERTSYTNVDVIGLAADLKLNFPLTSLDSSNIMTLEPFVKLGYGISYDLKTPAGTSSGNGPRYGFGVELYLFRELSVNAGWTRTRVSFGSPASIDESVRTFDIGLNYHFI